MKAATRGDRPEWFTTPKGLVSVTVCRVSGKLPDIGCSDVEVVSDTGEVSHRSMVITDYFPQGKAPSEVCPLHPGHNLLSTMAGWFGKDGPKPVAAAELGLPTQSAPGVTPEPPAQDPRAAGSPSAAVGEPVKKKRGFWSRVFGKDKDKQPPAPGAAPAPK